MLAFESENVTQSFRNNDTGLSEASIRPFEAAADSGYPALRGTLCRDIGPRQAIPPQQRCFCSLPAESGTPLLVAPLSDRGKESTYFLLCKDVAPEIQISGPGTRKEHAQRRIVAARKQYSAEDRQAKGNRRGQGIATRYAVREDLSRCPANSATGVPGQVDVKAS